MIFNGSIPRVSKFYNLKIKKSYNLKNLKLKRFILFHFHSYLGSCNLPDGYPAPLPEVRVGNVVGSINQVKSKKVLLKILGHFIGFWVLIIS
jgi:hypothetical protein